jgi:hypothetical protein
VPSLRFAAPFVAILRIRARRERQQQIGIVTVCFCFFVLRRLVRLRPRLMPLAERWRIADGAAASPSLVGCDRDRGALT